MPWHNKPVYSDTLKVKFGLLLKKGQKSRVTPKVHIKVYT